MNAKPWYTSKTLIFNLIWIAVEAAGLLVKQPQFADPTVQTVLVLIVTVGNTALRLVTNQPIANSPGDTDKGNDQ